MKMPSSLFIIICLFSLTACHEHPKLFLTPFQHFQNEDGIIELCIETDMAGLLEKQEEAVYQPIKLTLERGAFQKEHFHLETKPRGVFRKANCAFPPLKLRFPEEVLEGNGLMDYPTLKLVTHCQADELFDQLILKEYLTFKLYNLLTDHSFRTQLAKITYLDREGKMEKLERFGFLIEHPRELADRMNGLELGEEHGAPESIHLPAYKIFTLFQYMIGNTDWGLANRHNVKLIQPREGDLKLPIPVPYDFDFCGLVDAPYAFPHHKHPIKDVKERYFQWRGGEMDFTEVFGHFWSKEKEMLALVENCEYLTDSVRMEAGEYLASFFELLERSEVFVKE